MTRKSELSFKDRRKATNRRHYVARQLKNLRIEYMKQYRNNEEKVERLLHLHYPRLFGEVMSVTHYQKYG